MEYLELGKSGLKVSRICFGCAPMGGHDYGEVDDNATTDAVNCAIDNGINFFDVAAIYGLGRAETVLGKALAGKRQQVVVATKGGLRKTETKIVPDLSPTFLRADIEASLKRLNTEYIDIYQLHYPDPNVPAGQYTPVLEEFVKQGKIRAIGLSNFNVTEAERINAFLPVTSLQLEYNPLQRELEMSKVPEYCLSRGIGLITYSSLARGYVSGRKYSREDFKGSDTRFRSAYFDPKFDDIKAPVVETVREIALRQNKTPVQAALRWLLDKPFVSSAIVGLKSRAQVMEAVGACHWNIPKELEVRLNSVSEVFIATPLF